MVNAVRPPLIYDHLVAKIQYDIFPFSINFSVAVNDKFYCGTQIYVHAASLKAQEVRHVLILDTLPQLI